MKYALFSYALFSVAVLLIFTHVTSYATGTDDYAADHTLDDSMGPVGPVGNVDGSYKFDDGFHEKILAMINTIPQDGAPNVHDGKMYHDDDIVTFGILAHSIPSESVSISDRGNNTAVLSLNSTALISGTYAFVIEVHDGHNIEREICTVVVR